MRAALATMILFSIIASAASILGLNPFALFFNVSFVYLPTAALLVWTAYRIGHKEPLQ